MDARPSPELLTKRVRARAAGEKRVLVGANEFLAGLESMEEELKRCPLYDCHRGGHSIHPLFIG